MTTLVTPTPEGFLAVYQELLESVWHSGGLHRAKTTIAKKADTFLDALRASTSLWCKTIGLESDGGVRSCVPTGTSTVRETLS